MRKISWLFLTLLLFGCASTQTSRWQSIGQNVKNRSALNMDVQKLTGEAKPDGSGHIPYLKALTGAPKKVALVSVYVIDPSTNHERSAHSPEQWLKIKDAKLAANGIFIHGFPAMKTEFARQGMTLMAPDEFLDTDQKKKYYKNFKLKHHPISQPVDWAHNFLFGVQKNHKAVAQAADGFNEIYLTDLQAMDPNSIEHDDTLANRLGYDLTKGLEVDAVVIVLSQFTAKGNLTVLDETNMYMFGPNPVIVKKAGHQVGHHYVGVRAPFEFTYVENVIEPSNFEGYGILLAEMSREIGKFIELQIRAKN